MELKDLTFIDLTHSLSADTPHWTGQCGFYPKIDLDYEDCPAHSQFRVHKIDMFAGVGTHMDAPHHCFRDGITIAELSLNNLITHCIKIDVSAKANENYVISVNDIMEFESQYGAIPANSFVILYTGWDSFWSDAKKYHNNLIFPTVSEAAAVLLLNRNIAGLGIDTLSPDRPNIHFPVHHLLLGSGKYIVENVANANALPPLGALSFALPIKINEGTEAPIRLVAILGLA